MPLALYVNKHGIVYVTDSANHRIVAWAPGSTSGVLVAGGNGQGNALNQLNRPSDAILDPATDHLLVCDRDNTRVVRWPPDNGIRGELILSNIQCFALTMDDRGFLYVSVTDKHEVRRFKAGEFQGTVVSGGNGKGDRLDQLNFPTYLFVDRHHSLYVSDSENHRIVKWVEGAKEGKVVAGGNGPGNHVKQLFGAFGLLVDPMGTVYVADSGNNRIMRWPRGCTEGSVVIGESGQGAGSYQLSNPIGLSFGEEGHLYVADTGNHRVQKYIYSTTTLRGTEIPLLPTAQWSTTATTVAGGIGAGDRLDQLNSPLGLCINENGIVYVADFQNHRAVAWKPGSRSGEVVAGGNGEGNALNQLNHPSDVILDRATDHLLVCDLQNKRVVRWPRDNGIRGRVVLSDIDCYGLTMDDRGFLYVSVTDKHEIRRFKVGQSVGTVVAGGNGKGDRLDQLNFPTYLFVDHHHSLYVSDSKNHRIVKWVESAKEGKVVAGGYGRGNHVKQLFDPTGVLVDTMGTVYVADSGNHRIMRWPQGRAEGSVVVGESAQGVGSNQHQQPVGLSFGREGHLYVADTGNHRVQKYIYSMIPLRGTDMPLLPSAQWSRNATTVAGGNGEGDQLHQLNLPAHLYVDENEILYVADFLNHRVVAWAPGATSSKLVAGGNGRGDALNQLDTPMDVILDRATDHLLICDRQNIRVVGWPRDSGIRGELILSNIRCSSLTMDDRRFLYVSLIDSNEVRRFKVGESEGTVVAGGNGRGERLDQLDFPTCLFVDRDHSLYVSDFNNHRVVKWVEGDKEGKVVAGGNGQGNHVKKLFGPIGLLVDWIGTVYVADSGNNRIMRWPQGCTEGTVVVGESAPGHGSSELKNPYGLSFGEGGHLYVGDMENHRVQKYIYSVTPLRGTDMPLLPTAQWTTNATTVAGENGEGDRLDRFYNPFALFVDEKEIIYVADRENHCVVAWAPGNTSSELVAGGNGQGNALNQLNTPMDVILDRATDHLLICDTLNKRVVRWPRENGIRGELILSNTICFGLTMDDRGFLYVSLIDSNEVRRFKVGESQGTVVAGENGIGERLDQLNFPTYLFVDRDHSLYVSDSKNSRIVKWVEGAKEGKVVAGGNGPGNRVKQLLGAFGLLVDPMGTVYVADSGNNRIMRWPRGCTEGSVVIGESGQGAGSYQLSNPIGLSFGEEGHLYVADRGNHRVQKYIYSMTPVRGTDTPLLSTAQWSTNATTVAGGNGIGGRLDQLNRPSGLYLNEYGILYVAESANHRVVAWTSGSTSGEVVAGGNGEGNALNQLNRPSDVILDRATDHLLVCDRQNNRVVRWPHHNGTRGEVVLFDIACFGLTMDDRGFLYVGVGEKNEVRRLKLGQSEGTVVAGGNARGDRFDQLNFPTYLFVDRDHSLYVSDSQNDRIVKWVEGAKAGKVVAGGNGPGNDVKQLSNPMGVLVDTVGTVYVADSGNNRIMRWPQERTEGSVLVGQSGEGHGSTQLNKPAGLSFDGEGHLYTVDWENGRVLKYIYSR
ncbi:unnamed protein product, partial [Rotaria sp. Silwood1]